MSDEIKDGAQPAPQYTPMADPWEKPKAEQDTFEADADGLGRAAELVDEERKKKDAPILERKYYDVGEDGNFTGKDADPNLTVDIKRAALDLDRQRTFEVEQAQKQNDEAVEALTDATRAVMQGEPQPEVQQPAQQQPQSDEEAMRAALDNPKVREALDYQVQQLENQRAAYAKQAGESFEFAHATLFANFPELNGVTGQNLPVVLAAIEKLDPQRHIAVVKALVATDKLHQVATNAKHQEAQIAQARQQMWADAEEKKFMRDVIAKEPRETVDAVRLQGSRILQESYGIDPPPSGKWSRPIPE